MAPHTFYIYSNINFSRKSAAATRMSYFAKALRSETDSVYLLSCSSGQIIQENFKEVEKNIFVQNQVSTTKSLWGTLSFLRKMNRFSKKKGKKTFIFYPQPLLFLEFFSILYLKLYEKNQVYYEFNEVRQFSSSFHNPLSFKKVWYSIKKIVFKTTFKLIQPSLTFFDGLICISKNIERYGKRFNKNTIRVPILTDPTININKVDFKYHSSEAFNIGFSGSIAPSKENLDNFLNVLQNIKKTGVNVSFNLCGIIAESYYQELFEGNTDSSYIKYFGNLNQEELSTFLSQQDLLVIPRGHTIQNDYGFSTKLSDYLNHKKMILLTDISDNALYIKDGINGFIVPPDDNNLMFQKLKYIITNFSEIEKDIISKAFDTSKNELNYAIFKEPLQNFLKN